jgi:endonuclease G
MQNKIIFLLLISLNVLNADTFLHQFFNKKTCDQILSNKGYFTTCYSYKYKGAKYITYTLKSDLVNAVNLKKRHKFYPDLEIPKRYRSEYKDYTRNSFQMDRGHLAPDAAFDYSQRSLNSAYVMSNIIPQYKTVNRSKKMWAGVERYARYMATSLNYVNVLNGVEYGNNPKRIGKNQIAVPKAFWKMVYNKNEKFQKCFYFENKKQKANSIKEFIVDCKKIIKLK